MARPMEFALLSARDIAVAGVGAGIIAAFFGGEGLAFSVVCGALWVSANFLALSWLIFLVLSGNQAPRLFIFPVACAKLPASYFLLWWLLRAEYIVPLGVAIGICLMPPVLTVRGLLLFRQKDTDPGTIEEGR